MDDLIRRQAAIEAIGEKPFAGTEDESDYEQGLQNQWERDVVAIKILPPVQPEQRPLTEDDYAYCAECDHVEMCRWYPMYGCEFKSRPSAQPEIIRCKDCKYQDEGYRRISVKWLPCMDMRPGSNWYCGSAERREE